MGKGRKGVKMQSGKRVTGHLKRYGLISTVYGELSLFNPNHNIRLPPKPNNATPKVVRVFNPQATGCIDLKEAFSNEFILTKQLRHCKFT